MLINYRLELLDQTCFVQIKQEFDICLLNTQITNRIIEAS